MLDTHAHLDLPAFDADRGEALARAAAAGVRGALVPAVRPTTWARLLEVVGAHPDAGLVAALGVHPQAVEELDDAERALATDAAALTRAIAAARDAPGAPPVVAVGECGLDGGSGAREVQEAVLRAHVRAARALGLPLVVHVLRAHDAALAVLAEERAGEVGGVLHSYSGGAALVPAYAALGLAFSLAGPVTYPGARRPLEAARAIPADALLVETDAPDQAPAAFRPGRCEPAMLPAVVAAVAAARGEAPAAVAARAVNTALRVFPRWRGALQPGP